MNWNLEELRELVKDKHGAQSVSDLNPNLNAAALKLSFAQYHTEETQSNIKELLSGTNQNEPHKIVKLFFEQATDSEKGKKFRLAQFRAEANIIAFAQALHSVADIFSQIIFKSLNLENTENFKLKKDRLYLGPLTKELERTSLHPELTTALNNLLNSSEFKYLNAFVNTTKHICLINSRYALSLVEEPEAAHGMRISEFEYKEVKYDRKWSEKFLGDEFMFLHTSYVEIGNLLNKCLKS